VGARSGLGRPTLTALRGRGILARVVECSAAELIGGALTTVGRRDGGAAVVDGRREAALLLSEFLREFAYDLSRRMEPVLRGSGLVSILQVAMLKVLQRQGPMRLVDLSRCMDVPTSTLSELADRLVADDLVTRAPNPEDRRSVVLAVTDAGGRTLDAVRGEGAAHVGRLLRRVDDATVDRLLDGVRGLRDAVAAERAESAPSPGGPSPVARLGD